MIDDSKCRKNIYCDFEVSRDLPDAQIEICINCGKKVIYNKRDNRVDNKKYLRDHIRHFVQPFGKTKRLFYRLYGSKPMEKFREGLKGKKTKEEMNQYWEDVRKEATRYIGKKII